MSEKIKAKIIKALNVKPGNGETPESYTQRVLKKVAKLKNDEWDNLLDNPEQKWINEQITRGNNIKDAKEAGEEYTGEPIDWFTPPASEAQDTAPASEAQDEEVPNGEPIRHEDVGAESDEADEASEDDETQEEEADVLHTSESSKKKASSSKKKAAAKPAKKEAAAPKAKKATAKKKSGEENRGRKAVFAREQKIKLLVKENPHRKGTERWKRWNKYRNGMSVEEALDAGFNLNNLRYSVADKHIDIH